MMKKSFLYIAMLFALLLVGCSNDAAHQDDQGGVPEGQPLSLKVTTVGYSPSAGTRISNEGMETKFQVYDVLAVIVTHKDGTIEHLPFTLYNNDEWSNRSGKTYYYPGDTYAAYYPYREDMQGMTLEEVKQAFAPSTNQSDAGAYAASDFMTCDNVTLGSNLKLQITFKHAYAMLRMKNIGVKSKCGNGIVYDYIDPATEFVYYIDNVPYQAWTDSKGYARLIVKENSYLTTVKAGYTHRGKRYETIGSISSFEAGKYYVVEPPAFDLGNYTMADAKVGDYYCLDDNNQSFVIPGAAYPVNAKCIGIVFTMGRNNSDNGSYKNMGGGEMTTINGYVVAVKDAGSDLAWADKDGVYDFSVGTSDSEYDWKGYSNSEILKAYNTDGWSITNFPAANACLNFASTYPQYALPNGCSNWFMPSAAQLTNMNNNKVFLTNIFDKLCTASGDDQIGMFQSDSYWSSSEASRRTDAATYFGFSYGHTYRDTKDKKHNVRSIFVF